MNRGADMQVEGIGNKVPCLRSNLSESRVVTVEMPPRSVLRVSPLAPPHLINRSSTVDSSTGMEETEGPEVETRKRARSREPESHSNGGGSSPTRPVYPRDDPGPAVPKRVACTHCRQSKLRCDSPKDPCSRCARLGLACTKDTGYKRVSKKNKIDELEKHVQELRDVLDHGRPAATVPARPTMSMRETPMAQMASAAAVSYPGPPIQIPTFDSPREASRSGSASFAPFSGTPRSIVQESPQTVIESPYPTSSQLIGERGGRPKAIRVRAIESVALAREQIDALFQLYFDHFHPFFPLLEPLMSPDEYYESCPFLFWIVIAVGCRRYKEDPTVLSGLAVSVPKLLWDRVADQPLPYTVVQALLIFCMWPFPGTHMWSDASASYSSIALHAAFHMGMHRPEHAGEFTRNRRSSKPLYLNSRDPLERKRTWAGVNIVSQYMAVSVGYPPVGSCFDWSVDRACETGNAHTLPDNLRYHLMIQRFCYRVSKVMSGNVSDPLGLPPDSQHHLLMRVLEHDLNALEGEIFKKLSYVDRIYFHCARLQLGAYHWLGSPSPARTMGIIASYAAASALINEILAADASYKVLSYAPIIYPRMMWTAAYLILKVLNSSCSQHVDCEAGASLFHSAVAAVRRCSVEENDLAIRGANILADAWYRRGEIIGNPTTEPELVTRSRLGASLMFDCLWRWKEQCLKTESLQNTNPGPTGWPKGEVKGGKTPTPVVEPALVPFDWDLFDDMSWSWNFEIPPIPDN